MIQLALVQPSLVPVDTQKALPADGSRIPLDAYYTSDAVARACIAAVHQRALSEDGEGVAGTAWDPHVGGGAFARALLTWLDPRLVWGTDNDPDAPGLRRAAYRPDRFLLPGNRSARSFLEHPGIRGCRWIIGNPPYGDAEAHVRHALELGGRGLARHVVFLLRLAFVESMTRIPFWEAHPCRHIWALAKRPSFSACGRTDSCAYGLFWWDIQHTGPTTFTAGWDWTQQLVATAAS